MRLFSQNAVLVIPKSTQAVFLGNLSANIPPFEVSGVVFEDGKLFWAIRHKTAVFTSQAYRNIYNMGKKQGIRSCLTILTLCVLS